jgi:hypothetical protein
MMKGMVLLLATLLLAQVASADIGSIFALHSNNGKRLDKTNPGSYTLTLNTAAESQQLERLQYRGYFLLLNHVSNQYEVQVYKTVHYGNKNVNSIFASQFQASIEYEYSLNGSGGIRREHYLFPPNSLTGWANPGDFMTFKEFPWKASYPSKTCSAQVHSCEEFGREYLEASCFTNRDAAIEFAKKFIDYILGSRGM